MPTVLIIDDDQATRAALEMLLKKKKFGVFLAPDGPTGIRLLGSVSFDAVVIDMFMPGMDGLATIRELIKIDPTVPFVGIRDTPSPIAGKAHLISSAWRSSSVRRLPCRNHSISWTCSRPLTAQSRAASDCSPGLRNIAAALRPFGRHHDKNTGR
ncbi:response regulator [Bradyrhizobium sp. STM 3557]|uniref:response regulator n=1 Tax=Bradyrhizobium sp. STM 3557 TaxID=578920 RepID=UPI003890BE15